MKEVPLEAELNNATPQPADSIFDEIDRMTVMDRAYAKARESEKLLSDALTTESEESFAELRDAILADLNQKHGHIDEELVLNGLLKFKGIDPSKGFNSRGEATIGEFNLRANDANARSLGYITIMSVSDEKTEIAIAHRAFIGPTPLLGTEVATMYQSGNVHLPIDGSVDVQLLNEEMPPHFELLNAYVPELLEQIDAAIFDDSLPSKQLRALSKINFSDHPLIRDRGGEELKTEIANYINNYIDLPIHGICYIAGTKEAVIPIQDGYAVVALEKFRSAGIPHGIEFSPLDNNLVLRMTVPFHGVGMQELMYVLNSRITFTPAPQLMHAPSRTI